MIFATITDYDSWEYPYSTGDSKKLSGSIWVLEPDTLTLEGRWFPSKSVSGNTYRPNHEVGNILSYYEYGDLNEHPDIVQDVVTTKAPTTYTLNASTPFSWSLYGEEINHSSTDTTIEFGVDLRLQYGDALKASIKISGEDALWSIEIISDAHSVWKTRSLDMDVNLTVDLTMVAGETVHQSVAVSRRSRGIAYFRSVFRLWPGNTPRVATVLRWRPAPGLSRLRRAAVPRCVVGPPTMRRATRHTHRRRPPPRRAHCPRR